MGSSVVRFRASAFWAGDGEIEEWCEAILAICAARAVSAELLRAWWADDAELHAGGYPDPRLDDIEAQDRRLIAAVTSAAVELASIRGRAPRAAFDERTLLFGGDDEIWAEYADSANLFAVQMARLLEGVPIHETGRTTPPNRWRSELRAMGYGFPD